MNKIVLKSLAFITTVAVCFSVLCSSKAQGAESSGSVVAPRYTADDPLIVVSMGDSYSAGEGIEPFYGQKKDDNDENSEDKTREEKIKSADWIAHRSTKSWPSLLKVPNGKLPNGKDNYIELRDYKFKVDEKVPDDQICQWYFVAASGAETKHFYQDFDKGVATYDHGIFKKWEHVYLNPQLDVFKEKSLSGKVDYVTMSIGGNDMGFVNIVKAALKEPFNPNGVQNLLKDTEEKWKNEIANNIQKAYESVFEAAGGQVNIIVTGYPELYYRNVNSWSASKNARELIDNFVVKYCNDKDGEIVQIVKALNDEVKDKGWSGGIHYISVIDKFADNGGHGADSPNPWINGINYTGKEFAHEALLYYKLNGELKFDPQAQYSSMHPNADGAKAYAELVNEKIKEIEESKPLVVVKEDTSQKQSNYTWLIEPAIDAEDIIVFDNSKIADVGNETVETVWGHKNARGEEVAEKKDYAIIKKNGVYDFISYKGEMLSDLGKELFLTDECGAIDICDGDVFIGDSQSLRYYLAPDLSLKTNNTGCAHGAAGAGHSYVSEKNEIRFSFETDTNSIKTDAETGTPYAIYNNDKITSEFIFEDILSDNYGNSGIVACKQNNKWGYYSVDGEEILPCQFDEINCYYEEYSYYGSINKFEVKIFLPTDGYIAVCKDGGWGYYDTDGNVVIPCGEFEQARPVYDGHAWVKKDGKWGVISLDEQSNSDPVQEDNAGNEYSATWQQAYADFLRSNAFNIPLDPDSEWNAYYDKFSLCYVDDDDIPELVLIDAEPDHQYNMGMSNESPQLYSYKNGKMFYIGAHVGHDFSYLERQGKILGDFHSGNLGAYTLFELSNGELTELHSWSYPPTGDPVFDSESFSGSNNDFEEYLKNNVIDRTQLITDEGQYDLTEDNINTVLTSESGRNIQTGVADNKSYHGKVIFGIGMEGDEYKLDFSDNTFILTNLTNSGHTDTFSVTSHENNVYRVNEGLMLVLPDGTLQVSTINITDLIMTC